MLSLFWLHLVYNGWLNSIQNRDSKCHGINFCFTFNKPWALPLTCLHSLTCSHSPTCFLYLLLSCFYNFLLSILIQFFKIENFLLSYSTIYAYSSGIEEALDPSALATLACTASEISLTTDFPEPIIGITISCLK